MLKRSFIHIPGIGPVKEKKLWTNGIHDWGHLREAAPSLFKGEKLETVLSFMDLSEWAYEEKDFGFFHRNLPRDQTWRLVPDCGDRIAYLDIETTGTGMPPMSHSTTITFYFQGQVLQEHDPVKKHLLIEKIRTEASLLVTFFGSVFDVPYLEREYQMEIDLPHLDLCFWLKRQGYKGGLKRIQKQFSEIPQRESLDIDGFDAVRLWSMHSRGVPGALETLLTYNAEDTIVLEPLLALAFNREVILHSQHQHLELKEMSLKPLPDLVTRSHPEVYALLRGQSQELLTVGRFHRDHSDISESFTSQRRG